MRSIRSKGLALAAVASLTMFTAACGSDDSDTDTGSTESSDTATTEAPTSEAPTDEPTEEPTSDGGNTDVTANLAGPGCAAYAKQVPSGSGSVEGMSTDPVATAAGNNPLLKTLTAAVSGGLNKDVDLVDTLNSTDNLTVFAPVDDAFGKLDKATVTALSKPSGAETLTNILSYHVLTERVEPSDIGGSYKTLAGPELTVSGSPDNLKIEDDANGASVICGGVQTANATVYLIDTVLTPPAK